MLALNIALNCVLNKDTLSKQSLIALYPKNGLSSFSSCKYFNFLSPPTSSVLIITGLSSIFSATSLYAKNCSSSVGIFSLSIYKNSLLNSPTPSAEFFSIISTSAGVPIFATNSTTYPSLVFVTSSLNFSNSSFSFVNLSLIFSSFSFSSSVGFKYISPVSPFIPTKSPSLNILVASSTLVIAGIARVLAIIDVCELVPPISVIIPDTFLKSNFAVLDVVNSVATIIVLGFNLLILTISSLNNFASILFFMSAISLDLAAIYSSLIFSNICITLLNPISTAYSALQFVSWIILFVSSINAESCIIIKYADIISFSVPVASFTIFCVSSVTSSSAFFTLSISPFESCTIFFSICFS